MKKLIFLVTLSLGLTNAVMAQDYSDEKSKNLLFHIFGIDVYSDGSAEWGSGNAGNNSNLEGLDQVIDLEGNWYFNLGDKVSFESKDYDHDDWEQIYVPEEWERQGFQEYDGYAWYRKEFDGKSLTEEQELFLVLGFIDDVDETYINGHLIGTRGKFPPRYRTAFRSLRKYFIPSEYIDFNGKNVISVRVYDEYGEGGIVYGDPGVYVNRSDRNFLQRLTGLWNLITYDDPNAKDPNYDDSNWEKISVPAGWNDSGHRSFDGIAWYRKEFSLKFDPDKDKSYYLLLGKIDDFDITYLNGIEIGETRDNKAYGSSRSYNKFRVYAIPQGLLKTDAPNHIAIQVEDIGNQGGIYEGEVGIVTYDQLKSFR